MATTQVHRRRRPRHPMPADVRRALRERGLAQAYRMRPPYQRNDYLGWIARAVKPVTRMHRIEQMLDELEHGDRYMKMSWRPIPRRGESVAARDRPRKRSGR